jgi:hypothetical protein
MRGRGPERSQPARPARTPPGHRRDIVGGAASDTTAARSAETPQVVGPCANAAKKRHLDRQRRVSIRPLADPNERRVYQDEMPVIGATQVRSRSRPWWGEHA